VPCNFNCCVLTHTATLDAWKEGDISNTKMMISPACQPAAAAGIPSQYLNSNNTDTQTTYAGTVPCNFNCYVLSHTATLNAWKQGQLSNKATTNPPACQPAAAAGSP
jgi:hypothetical protein